MDGDRSLLATFANVDPGFAVVEFNTADRSGRGRCPDTVRAIARCASSGTPVRATSRRWRGTQQRRERGHAGIRGLHGMAQHAARGRGARLHARARRVAAGLPAGRSARHATPTMTAGPRNRVPSRPRRVRCSSSPTPGDASCSFRRATRATLGAHGTRRRGPATSAGVAAIAVHARGKGGTSWELVGLVRAARSSRPRRVASWVAPNRDAPRPSTRSSSRLPSTRRRRPCADAYRGFAAVARRGRPPSLRRPPCWCASRIAARLLVRRRGALPLPRTCDRCERLLEGRDAALGPAELLEPEQADAKRPEVGASSHCSGTPAAVWQAEVEGRSLLLASPGSSV